MTTTAKPLPIRDVVLATLVCGLLIGLLASAGSPIDGGAASTAASPSALRTIDFNQPATLAWSLRLGTGSETSLRGATCSASGRHVFICHGESSNGAEATVRILVADNGASWTTQ
jgi:hypothetical protein